MHTETKGMGHIWHNSVEPWMKENCHGTSSAISTTAMTTSPVRAAAGQAEIAQQFVGELSEEPWQEKRYDKHDAMWQAAASPQDPTGEDQGSGGGRFTHFCQCDLIMYWFRVPRRAVEMPMKRRTS